MYTLGLDYGTNSLRALIVRTTDGAEIGTAIAPYRRGEAGVVLDPREPELARQHPADYLEALRSAVPEALRAAAASEPGFQPDRIAAIGVDATGSTPLPVDEQGRALATLPRFESNPAAMAWLWKDHTATREAAALTDAARAEHPEYLAKCGGVYSSEWYWAKLWHCAASSADVTAAASSWIELADWIPAVLTGSTRSPVRGICAAGHKAMFHRAWGGYPDPAFLGRLHPRLAEWRQRLGHHPCLPIDHAAGRLAPDWAAALGGLQPGIPVAVGALDAHLGAVGSGVGPGTLVKILGTSTCDIMVHPESMPLPDIPGLCGIVPGSVLPGFHGLEAGQSAVGDIFNWFVARCAPAGATHESLSTEAARLKPGQSGLIALDWNNGNRTILGDQRLSGLLLGQTLATRPADIYRALIEATAFGARMILERLAEYGVTVDRIVNCGGIAEKSPLVMQIYADATGRSMQVSRSSQTCALGAAIAASVAAGIHPDIPTAQAAMTGIRPGAYQPDPEARAVYDELFALYQNLHDTFGLGRPTDNPARIMKQLLSLRERTRGTGPS